ncbi:hypothetical protein [Nocardiopsis synnemataformans]|uniref:hypothetical protein n=1 Tax=Nocardiopsis synnemataformans TaxID=61305 RepID=UPI003EC1508B
MASFSFKDADFVLNSVNLSDFTRSVTISVEAEELEDTAMGDDWRSRLGGLKSFSIDVEFNQDFAASAIDQTLWPLLGTTVAFTLKPTSAAVSETNPEYSGSVLITEYTPLDGAVGDLATTSVSFPGNGTLARAVS